MCRAHGSGSCSLTTEYLACAGLAGVIVVSAQGLLCVTGIRNAYIAVSVIDTLISGCSLHMQLQYLDRLYAPLVAGELCMSKPGIRDISLNSQYLMDTTSYPPEPSVVRCDILRRIGWKGQGRKL